MNTNTRKKYQAIERLSIYIFGKTWSCESRRKIRNNLLNFPNEITFCSQRDSPNQTNNSLLSGVPFYVMTYIDQSWSYRSDEGECSEISGGLTGSFYGKLDSQRLSYLLVVEDHVSLKLFMVISTINSPLGNHESRAFGGANSNG